MKTKIAITALLLVMIALPAQAEIIKSAIPCKTGNCLYWWPQAPSPAGWHQDREASEANGINVQIPDGFTFAAAETVIYAKALYKPLVPTLTSLAILIDKDKNDFMTRDPGLLIADAAAFPSGDDKLLKSFTFNPSGDGNWEQVAYGEEGDFYLIFTVSTRTAKGLAGAMGAYKTFIRNYKEKP
jgi:hypothetical protein